MALKAVSMHASAGTAANRTDSEAAPAVNPAKVRQFIDRLRQPDRLGTDFFSDTDIAEWDQWASTTPATLDAVSKSDWPLPIKMPRKCVQPTQGRTHAAEDPERKQTEIIAYNNVGGRRFTSDARKRKAVETRSLKRDEVDIGSTVLIKREEGEGDKPPGWDTPFYLGDVVDVDLSGDTVTQVTVHYRMPTFGSDFVNDATRAWKRACHGLHTWDRKCERNAECKAEAEKAGSETAAFQAVLSADTILSTGVVLTGKQHISAPSKRQIAECAPEVGAWNSALGIVQKQD